MKQYQQTTRDWLWLFVYDLKKNDLDRYTSNFDGLAFSWFILFSAQKNFFLLNDIEVEIQYLGCVMMN
jgi:para-aminobenzoate synthetase component 1